LFFVFLFLISCSDFSQSNLFHLELQTNITSNWLESFSQNELSLRDPVDLVLLSKMLSPFLKGPKSDLAVFSYDNPFHSTSLPVEQRAVIAGYFGGIYDPINNQIILIPYHQAPQSIWHRYDCATRTIEAYANPFYSTSTPAGNRAIGGAYYGGVYDPLNHQIIFVPYAQAPQSIWHRYDCATRMIESYENPFHSTSLPEENRGVSGAYIGGVYDPVNHQILFVPSNQGGQSFWHRYDCATRTIESYENLFHATSIPEDRRVVGGWPYQGGVYDPVNHQIIFVPYQQASQSIWHRYDCATKIIEAYVNPFDSTSIPEENRAIGGYFGGGYDAVNSQILFIPFGQAHEQSWHRYDCVTKSLEVYENPFHLTSMPSKQRAVSAAYIGGTYDPVSNQILFIPRNQAPQPTWHRYDCSSRSIEAYENPFHSTSIPVHHRAVLHAYYGGVYDPFNNQIVFIPWHQAPERKWHAIQTYGKSRLSSQFAAHYLFNKF
jgi:hypothetical protein